MIFQHHSLQVRILSYKFRWKVYFNIYLGLGPIFNIHCNVENISNTPMHSIYVSLQYNDAVFKILQKTHKLGYLIPGIITQFWIQVQNIDEGGVMNL